MMRWVLVMVVALAGCGEPKEETIQVLIAVPSIIAALVVFYLVMSTRLAILRTAAALERIEKQVAYHLPRMDERGEKAAGAAPAEPKPPA